MGQEEGGQGRARGGGGAGVEGAAQGGARSGGAEAEGEEGGGVERGAGEVRTLRPPAPRDSDSRICMGMAHGMPWLATSNENPLFQ